MVKDGALSHKIDYVTFLRRVLMGGFCLLAELQRWRVCNQWGYTVYFSYYESLKKNIESLTAVKPPPTLWGPQVGCHSLWLFFSMLQTYLCASRKLQNIVCFLS